MKKSELVGGYVVEVGPSPVKGWWVANVRHDEYDAAFCSSEDRNKAIDGAISDVEVTIQRLQAVIEKLKELKHDPE